MTFTIRSEAARQRLAELREERQALLGGSYSAQEDVEAASERIQEIDALITDLEGASNGPTPFARPKMDGYNPQLWIDRHEMFGTAYMDGLREIGSEMEQRDAAMREEVRIEGALKDMEAEIIIAGMLAAAGQEQTQDIFADCKNERQRDARLIQWKHTDPYYIEQVARLNDTKARRSRLEASIRMRELACSVIKRDMEMGTAVVRAFGGS